MSLHAPRRLPALIGGLSMVFLAVGFAQDVQKPGQISPACDPTADVWSFK